MTAPDVTSLQAFSASVWAPWKLQAPDGQTFTADDLAALCDEVERLREAVARVEAVRDRWTPMGLREAAIKHSLRAALDGA